MTKICPKCRSTEILPSLGGIIGSWKCEKCGFSGTLFPDVEKIKKKEKKKVKKNDKRKTKKN